VSEGGIVMIEWRRFSKGVGVFRDGLGMEIAWHGISIS